MPIYKFISQILIAFGILLINLFLFSFIAELICKAVFNVDVTQMLITADFSNADKNFKNAIRVYQGITSMGAFTVSSIIISFIFKKNPIEYLKLNKISNKNILLFIPLIFFISMPFLSWLININAQLKLPESLVSLETILKNLESKNNTIYELMLMMNSYDELFINLFVMALVPALGEELFCRGVLLNIFYDYSGKFYRSILIVAVIFTVFHLQFYKFIPMVTIAFILGVFVNWTQGLWASILFHFFNNCFAIIGKYYYNKGYDNFFTNQETNIQFYFVILSFVASFALLFYLNKIYKK